MYNLCTHKLPFLSDDNAYIADRLSPNKSYLDLRLNFYDEVNKIERGYRLKTWQRTTDVKLVGVFLNTICLFKERSGNDSIEYYICVIRNSSNYLLTIINLNSLYSADSGGKSRKSI